MPAAFHASRNGSGRFSGLMRPSHTNRGRPIRASTGSATRYARSASTAARTSSSMPFQIHVDRIEHVVLLGGGRSASRGR